VTFFVKRSETKPSTVEVHTTYGPISIQVDEHIGHARSFQQQLGAVLDELEAEQRAQFEAKSE
jgi:hypothetical protein